MFGKGTIITEVRIFAFDGTEKGIRVSDGCTFCEGWWVGFNGQPYFGPFERFEAACSHASSCRGGPSLVDENGQAFRPASNRYDRQGRLL